MQWIKTCTIFGLISIFAVYEKNVECQEIRIPFGNITKRIDYDYDLNPQRIVGGQPIKITAVPWQIAMIHQGAFLCGGSIISRRWILTAAHCVQPNKRYWIRAGTRYYRRRRQQRFVDLVVVHEKYNSNTLVNDIALLRLLRPLRFNRSVRPVRLAGKQQSLPDRYYASGWGYRSINGNTPKGLRGTRLDRVNRRRCSRLWGSIITKKMICATRPKKAVCSGDSGGPLVRRGVQFGINSFVSRNGCYDPNYPNVFTDVRGFRQWIARAGRQFS